VQKGVSTAMTTSAQQPDTATRLRGPLQRFRVVAYLTGLGLLALCGVMVLEYGFDIDRPATVYSPIHGVIYMVYVALTIDLAIKARWSVKTAIGVLLAGVVPFLSFFVERVVTRKTAAGERL